jgi:DNA-binding response OmpR family regulator
MPKILIIEDDPGITHSLQLALAGAGFETHIAPDGEIALQAFTDFTPDCVLLDLNLPKIDGMEVCRRIREKSQTPILILSARDQESDKVQGLELGADDYISKPFSLKELIARIQAVLKRATRTDEKKEILIYQKITLDETRQEVITPTTREKLTETEYQILWMLIQRQGGIVYREELMYALGYEQYVYDRTLDTHMKNIRKKIKEACTIETVRGVGYRLGE